jgi:hypothetical protein
LGYQAFYDMEKLQKIVLPSSITKIGKRAFRACYQLREINLDNITSIDEGAFYGISEMKI